MKTPEEIKKGLKCCGKGGQCQGRCPYSGPAINVVACTGRLSRNALAYIQQLESELETVKRERDAAVYALESIANGRESRCNHCVHSSETSCFVCWGERWEWRGVCQENTEKTREE